MNTHTHMERWVFELFLQLFSKFEIASSLPQTAAFHNRLHGFLHYTNVLIIFFFLMWVVYGNSFTLHKGWLTGKPCYSWMDPRSPGSVPLGDEHRTQEGLRAGCHAADSAWAGPLNPGPDPSPEFFLLLTLCDHTMHLAAAEWDSCDRTLIPSAFGAMAGVLPGQGSRSISVYCRGTMEWNVGQLL